MEKTFYIDQLHVNAFETREKMAGSAALKAGAQIISLLQVKPYLNIIFAAAPSQDEFLKALIDFPGIDWQRINAFHMDEYIGLPEDAPQSFGNYLNERVFSKVPFRSVHFIRGNVTDPEGEAHRYELQLKAFPPDIVFMGIGENGHIAFNDPHVADFRDPFGAKVISLDLVSRQQQVNDGCFSELKLVPEQAITLTIPMLVSAPVIYCVVPGRTKANAVFNTLTQPIVETYPATILRTHPAAELYIDADSAGSFAEVYEAHPELKN